MANAASLPPQQLKQLSFAEMSLLINAKNPGGEVSCFMCVIWHLKAAAAPAHARLLETTCMQHVIQRRR